MSTEYNHDVSQQGVEAVEQGAKKAGKTAKNIADKFLKKITKKIKNKVREAVKKVVNKVKQVIKKAIKKAAQAVKKAAQKTAKAIAKIAAKIGRAIIKGVIALAKAAAQLLAKLVQAIIALVVKLVALIGPVAAIILLCVIILCACFSLLYEERGSTGSNDLFPEVENPLFVSEEGILSAVAMTEPQAVMDAYYKLLSCSSYVKVYDNTSYAFNNTDTTEDFAGLRDYNKRENNFYLSDDFIRCVDELLHDDDLYYPEQVIKSVYGQILTLEDEHGVEGEYYTARLLFDTSDGDTMLDEEYVKDFDDMYVSGMTVNGASANTREVLPQSQTPINSTTYPEYYELAERDVVAESVQTDTEGLTNTTAGVWDYGLGSVLQYQPEEKLSYINCSYSTLEFGIHYYSWKWGKSPITGLEGWQLVTTGAHWSNCPISCAGTVDEYKKRCKEYCDKMTEEYNTRFAGLYKYYFYPGDYAINLEAIMDGTKMWDATKEYNSAEEITYTDKNGQIRHYKNEQIDARITDAWDKEIASIQFKNATLESDFGNAVLLLNSRVPTKLYPLNIAITNHASTFSGNIHYTIIPAGEEGCIRTEEELKQNTVPSKDLREPVTLVNVTGICSLEYPALKATRNGTLITMLPKVTETDAPWGFEYLQEYVAYYRGYVPEEFLNDRYFFLRSGVSLDGNYGYEENLKFLMELDLLHLYNGGIKYESLGSTDLADLNNPTSDLSLLSQFIAATAGSSKLEQLMVASVFVNRVQSDLFPNSFAEVLKDFDCYTDGSYLTAVPSDSAIASAIQVINGKFSIPSNILYCSTTASGNIYTSLTGASGTRYFCTSSSSETFSEADRFGRPSMDPNQLTDAANELAAETAEEAAAGSSIDYKKTVFLGDSLMDGLNQALGLSSKGAKVVIEDGASVSRLDELVKSQGINNDITNVYVLVGTFSTGLDDDTFKKQYSALVESINGKWPYATVTLINLPPVSADYTQIENRHIDAKNKVISNVAYLYGVNYLNVNELLKSGGALAAKYSLDGLFLTEAGYKVILAKINSGFTSSTTSDSTLLDSPIMGYYYVGPGGSVITSEYTLYEVENFDVLAATNMQAKLRDNVSGILAVLNPIWEAFETAYEQIVQFFQSVDEIFSKKDTGLYMPYSDRPHSIDIVDSVYHSLAFANRIWFSDARAAANSAAKDGDGLVFLFVGKNAQFASGSSFTLSGSLVPGIGTTVNGLISPTDTYYHPIVSYSTYSGTMELGTPEGTSVLAVGDGKVIEAGNNDSWGQYVLLEVVADNHIFQIRYGYLKEVNVSSGDTVSKGDILGLTGTNASGVGSLLLSVSKDGPKVDPFSVFYQSAYSIGASLGKDLYNADGTVNEASIQKLADELASYVSSGGGIYHNSPINTLSYLQCTWWVRGRGLQYLEETGVLGNKITVDQYKKTCWGNGGQYYNNNVAAGGFGYGTEPRPNSLVCYPGNPGHVAYVEAVDYVNRVYYISHAGSGTKWLGITKKAFGSASSGSGGQYGVGVFIYLDECKY